MLLQFTGHLVVTLTRCMHTLHRQRQYNEFIEIPSYIQVAILFRDNNNIAIIGTVIGAILVTCSEEKREDEMIAHIRLNSLLTALYINYALLIVAALAVYDLDFLNVMMYNMFTILLIFMVVFRYKIWRMKKGAEDEK